MEKEKIWELLHVGAESVAETVGAVFGLVAAGPSGAIVGAAAVPIVAKSLKSVLGDVAAREMSERERWRAGTAAAHAVNEIYRRLITEEKPRDDGFFQDLTDDRSPAETVLEGVLMTCRFQWEERKVPWIANIYVNAAFMNVPPPTVNRVIVLAERMSWRQIVSLALGSRDEPGDFPWDWLITSQPQLIDKQEVLREEMLELCSPTFGLITTDPPGATAMGTLCRDLMGLKKLKVDDIDKFLSGD